jgi:hypothetical protein
MNDLTINDYYMLTDQEIDYDQLPEDILEQLALDIEPYVANSALTELIIRESPRATSVALEIMALIRHERYLLSTALLALFRFDREKAWDYMTEHFPIVDPYLLKTMMELLLYETEFRFELPVAVGIFERLKTLKENKELLDPDVTEDFLGTMTIVEKA